jgi:hypothetical protein
MRPRIEPFAPDEVRSLAEDDFEAPEGARVAEEDPRLAAEDPRLPEEDLRAPEEDLRPLEEALRAPEDAARPPEDEPPEELDAERFLAVREEDPVAAAAVLALPLPDAPDFPLDEDRLDVERLEPDEDPDALLLPLVVAISMHLFVCSRSCYPRVRDR